MAHHSVEVAHTSGRPVTELFAGVGSVRRIGVGPLGIDETVTAVEPPRSNEYRITRGAGPVRNHRGRLEVSSVGTGSRVIWTIDYDTLPILGTALQAVLARVVERGLGKLA